LNVLCLIGSASTVKAGAGHVTRKSASKATHEVVF
jgi:hypothetical protein